MKSFKEHNGQGLRPVKTRGENRRGYVNVSDG